MGDQGIIVGCDKNQEWLLPWWWKHYSAHNSFPVAFADFGMTEWGLSWCRERGECFQLPASKIPHVYELSPSQKKRLKERSKQWILNPRSAWFKKPLALVHAPFSAGIWIDLDCRINGSLEPLFHLLALGVEIGLAKNPPVQESNVLLPKEVDYNSGVIVFRKGADIFRQWSEEACANHGNYATDDQALSRLIHRHKPLLIELPAIWNWLGKWWGPNREALVDHFIGGPGKLEILKQIDPALIPLIESLQNTGKTP